MTEWKSSTADQARYQETKISCLNAIFAYALAREKLEKRKRKAGGRILSAPTGCGARAAQGKRENRASAKREEEEQHEQDMAGRAEEGNAGGNEPGALCADMASIWISGPIILIGCTKATRTNGAFGCTIRDGGTCWTISGWDGGPKNWRSKRKGETPWKKTGQTRQRKAKPGG